jgi:signal transduction histidine kinase
MKAVVKLFAAPRYRLSRAGFALGSVLLVSLVGYLDYVSGFENSMLLFYLAPIAIATWYCGALWGVLIGLASVVSSAISDLAAGMPNLRAWNIACELVAYLIFVFVLVRWHELLTKMQLRVEQRTAALQKELSTRRRLEREISIIAEQERERLGRELHDSLCQHLVGTSLFAQTLALQTDELDSNVGEKAQKVVDLIDKGVELTRKLARGLLSFELDSDLQEALNGLAKSMTYEHGIDCRFETEAGITLPRDVANHLYWIAREAVVNSTKHAGANQINISLGRNGERLRLTVEDNGKGIQPIGTSDGGIGMKVMQQRAQLTGGCLTVGPNRPHGTVVCCELPIP